MDTNVPYTENIKNKLVSLIFSSFQKPAEFSFAISHRSIAVMEMFLWSCLNYTIAHWYAAVLTKQFINKQFQFRNQSLRRGAVNTRKAEETGNQVTSSEGKGQICYSLRRNLKMHFRVCRATLETRGWGQEGITMLKINYQIAKNWNRTNIAHNNLTFVSFFTAARNSTVQVRIGKKCEYKHTPSFLHKILNKTQY